jgi:predicted esterase
VIDKLAPLDPAKHIGDAGPAVLLQFGRRDRHVPAARAKVLIEAAKEPKEVRWYDAGHALDEKAVEDRLRWLRSRLKVL